jgi:RND family efflux transporter MFP subunit
VVSEQEREEKKADYNSASARLFAANAQVALDQSRVDQYTALTQFKQVRAPFDGVITERKIDLGNLVTAGSNSTTTPLYRITQNHPLRVFVDVPQSAAQELMKPGVPAQVRSTGSYAGVFEGQIARSAEAINPQARTMRVEVDLPNANDALIPGMYVTVAFRLQARGLAEVPAAALIFRAGGPLVARVNADGRVEFVKVDIVRDNGSLVDLGPSVKPGDRLVLNISSQIAAGQTVAVNAPEPASAGNDRSGRR